MKLNIGCGYTYLKGYLNVDASGDSLADAIMEAHDLCLDSASVDEITASQLVEHLGFSRGSISLPSASGCCGRGGRSSLKRRTWSAPSRFSWPETGQPGRTP